MWFGRDCVEFDRDALTRLPLRKEGPQRISPSMTQPSPPRVSESALKHFRDVLPDVA